MVRKRLFLETDVVDAAKTRLRHVAETFDTIAVQYSGGKDSTAVLWLAKQVLVDELGHDKVTVIFRDEEMVSPSVVEHIEKVKNYDWVNFEHYCLAQGQEIWVLGRREYALLWSEQRRKEGRLIREMPPDAITNAHFGLPMDRPIPESVDYYTMQGKEGKTAFLTGVRAAESMMRYRAVVQKLSEPYIQRPWKLSKSIPLRLAKVIYDWEADDVFKFINDAGGEYAAYYDYAILGGANTRVGIPLHAVAARRLRDVVNTEPEFYDRLVECFPQIDANRRLWADFDIEAVIKHYSSYGWDGIQDLIDDYMLSQGNRKAAMIYAAKFRKKQEQEGTYAYPLSNLARVLLLNDFHSTAPQPVGPRTRAYTVREAQIEQDANDLDLKDDFI